MSNSARKARKRAGESFIRTPKVATPMASRTVLVRKRDRVESKKFRAAMQRMMGLATGGSR
jgi:hypothetical protein